MMSKYVSSILLTNALRILGLLPPSASLKSLPWETINQEAHSLCGYSSTGVLDFSKKNIAAISAFYSKLEKWIAQTSAKEKFMAETMLKQIETALQTAK